MGHECAAPVQVDPAGALPDAQTSLVKRAARSPAGVTAVTLRGLRGADRSRVVKRSAGRRGGGRFAAGLFLGWVLALAPHAAAAYERVHTLRWTQPSGGTPSGFSVSLGSRSGQYGETRDLGSVPAAADGVRRKDLVLDAFQDYFVVVTAYNSAGSSPPSNELVVERAACDATFCEDGNVCTADACGATDCSHEPLPDGTSCPGGLCDAGACQPVQCLESADCSDGNACNGVEVCAGSLCRPGTAPSCGGATACTTAACDATIGCVIRNKADGSSCDDGNASTTADRCSAGVCAGTPGSGGGNCGGSCNDGDPCTVESCVEGACRVAPAANGTSCDDGNATTVADMCSAGVCRGTPDVVGPPICGGASCEDGNLCTADACSLSGCTHIPLADGTSCDDGNRRTPRDRCQAGSCVGKLTREFDHGKWWGSRRWWDKRTAPPVPRAEPAPGESRRSRAPSSR